MGKILFWVSIFIGSLVVTRVLARAAAGRQPSVGRAAPRKPEPNRLGSEQMVRCDHCGIHLPVSEATRTGLNTWCSPEHAKLGAKQRV